MEVLFRDIRSAARRLAARPAITAIAALSLGFGVGANVTIFSAVTQRHHEMGIRIALGASASDVLRLVLRHGMTLVGAGIVGGAVLGLALGRYVRAMLWGVGAVDPVTYLAVASLLALVALAANLVPALRLTRVDPLNAMHDEY